MHPLLYGDVAMAWKVLSAEASVRSVERLIPIVRLLKLNEDNLYVAAADNAITRYQVSCYLACFEFENVDVARPDSLFF